MAFMDWIDVHGLDLFSWVGFVFTGWIRTLDLDLGLGLDIGHWTLDIRILDSGKDLDVSLL